MIIHVYSGLMSRCRTLSEAYFLAKKYNDKKLVIIWPLEKACRIHYTEVYDSSQFNDLDVEVIEYDETGLYKDIKKLMFKCKFAAIIKELSFRKHMKELTKGTTYVEYNPSPEIGWKGEGYIKHLEDSWKKVDDLCKTQGPQAVYAHAFNRLSFGEDMNAPLECIKFQTAIDSRAEDIIKASIDTCQNSEDEKLNKKTNIIGIHVRRTDHIDAIANSATQVFIDKMKEEIAANEKVLFFLATDSTEEESRFKELFGDRILVQKDKIWGRDDSDAMKSGIIDMLCLSKCDKIYGSFKSAYSLFAAEYGGIELIIC